MGAASLNALAAGADREASWWFVPAAATIGTLLEAGKYLAGATTLTTLEDRS